MTVIFVVNQTDATLIN